MYTSMLNKSVIIEKSTETTNAVGTPVENFSFLKESYAGMTLRDGNTAYTDTGELAFNNVEFLLRYDSRINYSCRLKYENQYYKIKHIQVVGRKDWMQVRAIVWEEE